MKKLMTVAALVASALVFTGCGGKPKIPANTVAAAYVDLDNLIGNAFDVVDDAIDEIPNKEKRKEMREEFKKFVKEHKPDFKAIDAEWLVITMGIDKEAGPEFAAVLKCDCKTPIPSAGNQSVKDLFKDGKKIASEAKYDGPDPPRHVRRHDSLRGQGHALAVAVRDHRQGQIRHLHDDEGHDGQDGRPLCQRQGQDV